jgi:hypothetical protein
MKENPAQGAGFAILTDFLTIFSGAPAGQRGAPGGFSKAVINQEPNHAIEDTRGGRGSSHPRFDDGDYFRF